MIKEDLRDYICSCTDGEAILFDNPSFDNSIIGIDSAGSVVYDYDKMVEELMQDDGITMEEAIEFIEYNTMRALPYCHFPYCHGNAPIIVFNPIRDGDY